MRRVGLYFVMVFLHLAGYLAASEDRRQASSLLAFIVQQAQQSESKVAFDKTRTQYYSPPPEHVEMITEAKKQRPVFGSNECGTAPLERVDSGFFGSDFAAATECSTNPPPSNVDGLPSATSVGDLSQLIDCESPLKLKASTSFEQPDSSEVCNRDSNHVLRDRARSARRLPCVQCNTR